MTVSPMGLQLFKGSKPVETLLYQNMRGWADENGDTLVVELSGGSNVYATPEAKAITDKMTEHAKALAAAQKAAGPTPTTTPSIAASGDSPMAMSGGEAPAPRKKQSMRRRMSVIASGGMRVDSPRALPETEMYDATQGKKKVQLQVGSMAL